MHATDGRPAKFLVTGTGRSGTLFIATALRESGIRAGHEDVYSRDGYRPRRWYRYDGDVSWMALPAIDCGAARPSRIIHVVRDPRRVIASRYEIGISQTMDGKLLRGWPRVGGFPADDVDAAVRLAWMCELWCALIDRAAAISQVTFRLEDIPAPSVAAEFMLAIGYPDHDPGPLSTTPRDINHSQEWRDRTPAHWRAPEGGFAWEQLPAEVRTRARALGYEA